MAQTTTKKTSTVDPHGWYAHTVGANRNKHAYRDFVKSHKDDIESTVRSELAKHPSDSEKNAKLREELVRDEFNSAPKAFTEKVMRTTKRRLYTGNEHIFLSLGGRIETHDLIEKLVPLTNPCLDLKQNGKKLNVTIEEFLRQLVEFEDARSKSTGHGKCERYSGDVPYLDKVTLMIPEEVDEADFPEFAQRIMDDIMSIYTTTEYPSFCRWFQQGRARYFDFYFARRHYFEGGKEVNICRRFDDYFNPKTNQRCSATTEGAVLRYRKGEVLRTEFRYFDEDKIERAFASRKQFCYVYLSMVNAVVKVFSEVRESSNFNLPRYNGGEFCLTLGRTIKQYNTLFAKTESVLKPLYKRILELGEQGKEKVKEFAVMLGKMHHIITHQMTRQKTGSTTKIKISTFFAGSPEMVRESYETMECRIERLVDEFKQKLERFLRFNSENLAIGCV